MVFVRKHEHIHGWLFVKGPHLSPHSQGIETPNPRSYPLYFKDWQLGGSLLILFFKDPYPYSSLFLKKIKIEPDYY